MDLRTRRSPNERLVVLAGLGVASALCLGLELVREHRYGAYDFRFLIWNLILAWIPLLLALIVYDRYRRGRSVLVLAPALVLWLLFLPNAPYIVTDFVHLSAGSPSPLWLDGVEFSAFAWTGCCLASSRCTSCTRSPGTGSAPSRAGSASSASRAHLRRRLPGTHQALEQLGPAHSAGRTAGAAARPPRRSRLAHPGGGHQPGGHLPARRRLSRLLRADGRAAGGAGPRRARDWRSVRDGLGLEVDDHVRDRHREALARGGRRRPCSSQSTGREGAEMTIRSARSPERVLDRLDRVASRPRPGPGYRASRARRYCGRVAPRRQPEPGPHPTSSA